MCPQGGKHWAARAKKRLQSEEQIRPDLISGIGSPIPDKYRLPGDLLLATLYNRKQLTEAVRAVFRGFRALLDCLILVKTMHRFWLKTSSTEIYLKNLGYFSVDCRNSFAETIGKMSNAKRDKSDIWEGLSSRRTKWNAKMSAAGKTHHYKKNNGQNATQDRKNQANTASQSRNISNAKNYSKNEPDSHQNLLKIKYNK